jgi:type I restriction enzyme S subunit
MASVEALSGRLDPNHRRPWHEVKTGYTRFQDGDVLIAKITPSMENGKAALARGLATGVGAGSTEFHVLRPGPAIRPELLLHYVLQEGFRRSARAQMTGTAGQLRVPSRFLDEQTIPVPPLPEQHRIVEAIESYFTRLDDAVATLERVQGNLKRFRASVLKAAVEGRLVATEAELASAEGRDYEPASVLLERILAERRRRWEEAELGKMKAKGKGPKDDKWKAKYKEPSRPDESHLPVLPEGWCWATWAQVGLSQNGRAFPSSQYCGDGVPLLRPGNLHVSGRVAWTRGNTRSMPSTWERDFPEFVVGPNELVMNLTAQSLRDEFLGRVCMTGAAEHCLLNQRIARLTPVLLRPKFILWWFKTPLFRTFVDGLNTGSLIQHMFTSQLADFAMPIPPLLEQDRIVDEVERHIVVADTIEDDLRRNESRVPTLRQSILKWTFEGRLVDQDPTDEPASVLLERIRAEREAKPAQRARTRRRARAAKTDRP